MTSIIGLADFGEFTIRALRLKSGFKLLTFMESNFIEQVMPLKKINLNFYNL